MTEIRRKQEMSSGAAAAEPIPVTRSPKAAEKLPQLYLRTLSAFRAAKPTDSNGSPP